MNPWIPHLLRAGGGSGGAVLPPTGRTMLANLTSSLILDEGTGGPTWSRATKAWGFNELGYLEEIASGCAFFGGARLVRNLVPTPSNTLAVAGTKTVTLTQAATLQFSMGAGAGTATFSGTGGASGTLAAGASRVSVNKTVTAGTFIVTASVDALVDLSVVDVTNYDASYIPEYVSVGVEASPYFGAGIDGAKYFETDWQGAPIPTDNLLGFRRESAATNNIRYCRDLTQGSITGSNLWVTESYGDELVTNGTFDTDTTGWTFANASGAVVAGQLVVTKVGGSAPAARTTISTTIGQSYQISLDFVGDTSTKSLYLRVGTIAESFNLVPNVSMGSSSASGLKYNFIAATTTTHIQINGADSYGAGETFTIDNVSVKTSKIAVSLNATGIDGIANTATTLTATAADAIILQPISLASAARCASAYVKRRTGTGAVSFTQDGGSTWTDITSQINGSTWSRVEITATLANPSVGFKISTSGDAIDVDCVQNEAGAVATSPIVTTTAAVTRNADSLTYQTASNWSDTEGTLYFEAAPYEWKDAKAVAQAYLYNIKSGIYTWDGTEYANGPTGVPSGREKLAVRWSTVTGKQNAASSGGVGAIEANYDGSWGMASIGIFSAAVGYCGRVAIYNYAMTDAELQALTT